MVRRAKPYFQTSQESSPNNEARKKKPKFHRNTANNRGQRRSRFVLGSSGVMCDWAPNIWRITVELTRRREFIQASPDESSCETRSRRSRPTNCWALPAVSTRCCFVPAVPPCTSSLKQQNEQRICPDQRAPESPLIKAARRGNDS